LSGFYTISLQSVSSAKLSILKTREKFYYRKVLNMLAFWLVLMIFSGH